MRVKIVLACTECKQRNYNTKKNKKNDPDRLENEQVLQVLPQAHPAQGNQVRSGRTWQKTSKRPENGFVPLL